VKKPDSRLSQNWTHKCNQSRQVRDRVPYTVDCLNRDSKSSGGSLPAKDGILPAQFAAHPKESEKSTAEKDDPDSELKRGGADA